MSTNNEVLTGIVKFYNPQKGYGFIIEKETEKEYFFHISDVADNEEYNEGEKVYFGLKDNLRGIKAIGLHKRRI